MMCVCVCLAVPPLGRGGEGKGEGRTVADVIHGEKKMKTTAGHMLNEVDAAW